ncbi:hypothetical protein NIES25_60480 (plasmid) [Nostoc linckia NIES-25]|nr:hypothetical protein NIES25_60480 [Nostoc linckia NIES-25]
MASRQKAKQKFPDFIKIRQWLNFMKRYLIAGFLAIISALKRLLRISAKHQNLFLVLLLILFFTFLTFAAIVPGTHTFEGNITAEKMSFIYKGEENKLLLQNIRCIKELENEGRQTLTFTGTFQTPEFSKLNSLKIRLKDRESRWIITPVNSQDTSEISLEELRLQPNTKVTGLSYDFYRNQLAFSLQPNSNLNPKIKNTIDLYLGQQPIKVVVEGYELPGLKLPKQFDKETPLEFILTPNNKINLNLTEDASLYITVSKSPKYESEQWFRGKIKAENLQF